MTRLQDRQHSKLVSAIAARGVVWTGLLCAVFQFVGSAERTVAAAVRSDAGTSTVTIVADKAAYVSQGTPTGEYGGYWMLKIGSNEKETNKHYIALIEFDLSTVPADAQIISAALRLKRQKSIGKDSSLRAYIVGRAWSEQTVTWNNKPSIYASKWVAMDARETGAEGWDVTDFVRRWVSGTKPNHGLYIRGAQWNSASNHWFYSDDSKKSEYHPQLLVTFTVPVAADEAPPAPDPLEWARAPEATGSASVRMASVPAADAQSPPVEYDFSCVVGRGGHDSGWQSEAVYEDTGLSPNTLYVYAVKARDSAEEPNETAFADERSVRTLADVPPPPRVGNPSQDTLDVTVLRGNNPPDTELAVYNQTLACYLTPDGVCAGADSQWHTEAQWGTITAIGLPVETDCEFRIKARNKNNTETGLGEPASAATTPEPLADLVVVSVQGTLTHQMGTAAGVSTVATRVSAVVTIRNAGQATAPACDLTYTLGTDTDREYRFIQKGHVEPLAAGETASDTIVDPGWAIPEDVPAGDGYRIWVKADSSDSVVEANEHNNWGSASPFRIERFSVESVRMTINGSSGDGDAGDEDTGDGRMGPVVVGAGDRVSGAGEITGSGNGTIVYHWEYRLCTGGIWFGREDRTVTMKDGSAAIYPDEVETFGNGCWLYRLAIISPGEVSSNEVRVDVAPGAILPAVEVGLDDFSDVPLTTGGCLIGGSPISDTDGILCTVEVVGAVPDVLRVGDTVRLRLTVTPGPAFGLPDGYDFAPVRLLARGASRLDVIAPSGSAALGLHDVSVDMDGWTSVGHQPVVRNQAKAEWTFAQGGGLGGYLLNALGASKQRALAQWGFYFDENDLSDHYDLVIPDGVATDPRVDCLATDFGGSRPEGVAQASGLRATWDVTFTETGPVAIMILVDVRGYGQRSFPLGTVDLGFEMRREIVVFADVQGVLGTVVIDPTPDRLDAPWSLLFPDGTSRSGSGGATISDTAPGEYAITWGRVAGWAPPEVNPDMRTLEPVGTVTFTGQYAQASGSLRVIVTPREAIEDGARWRIDGTLPWRDSGETVGGLALGEHGVTFADVPKWIRPEPVTVVIAEGEAQEIIGDYAPVKEYALSVSTMGQGSVKVDPPDDAMVRLTARADTGWHFVRWEGGTQGTEAATMILMDSDKSVTAVFERDLALYALSTDVRGYGRVAVDPFADTFDEGTTVQLTAEASPGWHFVRWEGGTQGAEPVAMILMNGDKSATAIFERDVAQYALSTDVRGQGRVTADPSAESLEEGTTVQLTAEAGPGWHFVRWEGGSQGAEAVTTILMDSDKSVTAIFERDLAQYVLSTDVRGQGRVTSDPSAESLEEGTTVQLTAEASPGWHFVRWEGGTQGAEPVAMILMNSDKSVTAVFERDTPRFTLSTSIEGQGSVDLDPPGGTYDSGVTVQLNAETGPEWHFVAWRGDVSSDHVSGDHVHGEGATTTVLMDRDKQVTAVFDRQVREFTLLVRVRGHGTANLDPPGSTHADGTTVQLRADPDPGWRFVRWEGEAQGADPVTQVLMYRNKNITAVFEADERGYALSISVEGKGSVALDPPGGTYSGGPVQLKAIAQPGWWFAGWTGDSITNRTNPVTIEMDADKAVTAVFERASARAEPPSEPATQRNVIYVDADAGNQHDGAGWATAFGDLQDALAAAQPGEEIWVAAGVYKPDRGAGDRTGSYHLVGDVPVYGGFTGQETKRDQRDPVANKTILSGDLGDDDGPDLAGNEENAYHVVTGAKDVSIDGFIITGGNANGSDNMGGGMFNGFGSSVKVANCVFVGNSGVFAGGGLYSTYSDVTITNCIFQRNSANMGGGIYGGNSHTTVTNTVLAGNSATYWGGAIRDSFGSVMLTNCTVSGNHAGDLFGGGGIDIVAGSTSLTNCIVWGNSDAVGNDESGQIRTVSDGSAIVDYSCIQGWTGTLGGLGNTGEDPRFVDSDGLDNVFGTEDDDFHLRSGSSCIDTGNPQFVASPAATDLDGRERVRCERVDMGAFEYGTGENDCPR